MIPLLACLIVSNLATIAALATLVHDIKRGEHQRLMANTGLY